MGKLVITTNMTLDGVVQDPDGKEGFRLGGWHSRISDADREAWAKFFTDEALRTDALLLGRRSDEYFGTRWASRSGVWADRLNGLPKYVVSSALEHPVWTNVTVLDDDILEQVARLKRDVPGEIAVYASYELTQTLLEHDLIDEVRVVVFPMVVGSGDRLFRETSHATPLRLRDATVLGDALVLLTYETVRAT
ncbi:MAG TPA: dihydrofolate reductase family protein [Jatrophihabitantaceae bacterium]|nr:dihydrofolate reductase family protein [Jatrophihabitantaceae bacterium]